MIARLEDQKDYYSAILSIKNLIDQNYEIKYFILGRFIREKAKKLVNKLNLQNNVFF